MPQTSQDILELDTYDVYLLIINVGSKNGMRGNCPGSAGSEGVDDIRSSSDNRKYLQLRNIKEHSVTSLNVPPGSS